MRRALLIALVSCVTPLAVSAHDFRPAYLELHEISPGTYDVLWKVPAVEERRLALDVRFPFDARNLSEPVGLFLNGAYVERWRVERTGGLSGQSVTIEGLAATSVDALIRITDLRGITQTMRATPDAPTTRIAAQPSRWQVSRTYLALGVEHILGGVDHLLFVLALVFLVSGWRKLAATITAFTVAHSLTLALATLGVIRVPVGPVEACIALSIAFVAAEIIRSRQGQQGLTARATWFVAFAFGLLHGLGFASALREVGLPSSAIPFALLFFNVGVEIGQLSFVLAVLALADVSRALPVRVRAAGWRITPYAIGSVAMFWVIQRTVGFLQ